MRTATRLENCLQLVKPDEDNPPEEAEKEGVEIDGDAYVPWDSKELAPTEVQFSAKLQFTGTDIWYFDQIVDENIKSWYNCR